MADDDYYDFSYSDTEVDDDYGDDEVYLNVFEDRPQHQGACYPNTTVITKESFMTPQKEELRKVMELLALREHHARTLLIYYRWNWQRITDSLVAKGIERLLSEAGVAIMKNRGHELSTPSILITCQICFEEFPPDSTTVMDCEHCFCNDCWTKHFIVQINDGQSRRVRCMADKCNAICDETVVRLLVGKKNLDLANRFKQFLLESYLEDNDNVKWCPSMPHCGNAIRVEGYKYCEVNCKCGFQFCFKCLSEAHSPCTCLMWELWYNKCNDESENVNWIIAHTQFCPNCHWPVQKISGCNLVTCLCGQPFCWLCGDDATHNHFEGRSCNLYKGKQEESAKLTKRSDDRFIHHYIRYKAHKDSLKKESELEGTMREKISICESKIKMKNYSWAMKGLHLLLKARRVLSYTYPFAFYMFGDELFRGEMTKEEKIAKKNLFEDLQEQLECNVEQISMLFEKNFHEYPFEDVVDMMMHVINRTNIVDTQCEGMYQFIQNDLLLPLRFSTNFIAPYKFPGFRETPESAAPHLVNLHETGKDESNQDVARRNQTLSMQHMSHPCRNIPNKIGGLKL